MTGGAGGGGAVGSRACTVSSEPEGPSSLEMCCVSVGRLGLFVGTGWYFSGSSLFFLL